jgi:hypothetical protein
VQRGANFPAGRSYRTLILTLADREPPLPVQDRL